MTGSPSAAALAFLSRDWAGLAAALAVAAAGAALIAASAPWAGWPLAVCAGLMAAGALRHLLVVRDALARHPPPGRLIDVDGRRIHVLAEGEAKGRPAAVWFAGGHAPGLAAANLHRRLRTDARSILIDRPGTGWSDPGRFPRTTPREAREIAAALAGAGEEGPFVFVGHSFGGLLAAHVARLRPDLTASVVLLDATPPDTIIYGPRFPGLPRMARAGWLRALRLLFGLHGAPEEAAFRRDPAMAALLDVIGQELAAEQAALRALGLRSRGPCAEASIYRELERRHLADAAWETAIYDGDLDGTPLLLVAPADVGSGDDMPLPAPGTDAAAERARMMRVVARTRERYLAASDRSRRVFAPAGTGHNFPFEAPDFTVGVVREAIEAGRKEHRT